MTRVRAREDGKLRAAVLALAARAFNFRHWDATWRVTPELLRAGEVGVACSVLYRPFSELDLDEPYGAPPRERVLRQARRADRRRRARGRAHRRHRRALGRRPRDGADGPRYVHCIEGGFHLGATPEEVTAHVHELADRGVLYITLAHLFWRRVAANTPALPFLPDPVYNRLFPQPPGARPVTARRGGRAGDVRAPASSSTSATCARTRSTRRSRSSRRSTGRPARDPHEYPVIASHAGVPLRPPAVQRDRRDDRARSRPAAA